MTCPSANSSCNQDMDSSSSSTCSSSSVSYRRDGQDGLQQSPQEQPQQHPLFFIKPIDSQGQSIGKKRLEDLGGYYDPEFKLPHMSVVCLAVSALPRNLRGLRRDAPVRAACRSLTRSLGEHLLKWNGTDSLTTLWLSVYFTVWVVHVLPFRLLQETHRWTLMPMSRLYFWLWIGATMNELPIIASSLSGHRTTTKNWVRRTRIQPLEATRIKDAWPCIIAFNSLCSPKF